MDEKEKKLVAEIEKVLDGLWSVRRDKEGNYECEIYADYRDEMDQETACEILTADDPEQVFAEKLDEWYQDCERDLLHDLAKEVGKALTKKDGPYPEGLSDEDGDVRDYLQEMVYFTLPFDHYLDQEFPVDIMLDTGDGNYDYTLNSPFPCWCGQYGARLDEKSSLLWLARQQGYTKTQLWRALQEGDMADPKGFLKSCRVELANLPSHMAATTFLVRMTLRALIELGRCIKLQDRNGHFYDATENPYCGYIVLGKETMTGLYDPWNGGGSVLEIELEKDVRIPIRFIRSALPDGCDGYSIRGVYGICGSAWKQGEVKLIHAPTEKTLRKEMKAS